MLARIQQLMVVSTLLIATVWTLALWPTNKVVAASGLVVILFGWSMTIVIEMLLLAALRKQDPTPKASHWTLAKAWWFESAAVVRVFCWRQPFRSHRWPDPQPDAGWTGRRGVVFVHGFVCNRAVWNSWLEHLTQSRIPYAAVDLEPVFSGIDGYAETIDRAVQHMLKATGMAPLLVAHSMGGLAVRAWLNHDPSARIKMHRCATIGTPHQGTWLARLGRSKNALQMRPESQWLANMQRLHTHELGSQFVCWYSNCDNVVMPPATATLAGAENRFEPGLGHVSMVLDDHIMRTTLAMLGPETRAQPTDHGASGPAPCSQTRP